MKSAWFRGGLLALALMGSASAGSYDHIRSVIHPISLLEQNQHEVVPEVPEQGPHEDIHLEDPLVAGTNPEGLSGYVTVGQPYDNINNKMLTDAALNIPESPECTIRSQTVVEIEKLRKSAAQMAASIGVEAENMEKRKSYIEEMSAWVNDRIRELNKIKYDLSEELRWVTMTNTQIELLNKREEQMKLDDILSCMGNEKNSVAGHASQDQVALKEMELKEAALTKQMTATQKAIMDIQEGKDAGGSKEEGASAAK